MTTSCEICLVLTEIEFQNVFLCKSCMEKYSILGSNRLMADIGLLAMIRDKPHETLDLINNMYGQIEDLKIQIKSNNCVNVVV